MPSITFWNRLEPSPRADDLVEPLAARVADPLWFLTRQWQFGEFRAADCGSPAWLELDTSTLRLTHWSAFPGQVNAVDPTAPLEKLAGESRALDLATSVEIGQLFEVMLSDAAIGDAVPAFRTAYATPGASLAELVTGDEELLRFRALIAGRTIDGASLYREARVGLTAGLTELRGVSFAASPALAGVLWAFVAAVDDLLGVASPPEPGPLNPQRFEYELDLVVAGSAKAFTSRPGRDAELTWDTLERSPQSYGIAAEPERARLTYLPASVGFRGAPSRRWWDFDSSAADFGRVDAEPRDLAMLVLGDMVARQGRDWYVVPLEQEAGTLQRLESVLVRDVFGILNLVPEQPGGAALFAITGFAGGGHLLLTSTATFIQFGEPLEEVRFLRDDMISCVWAVEEVIESPLGEPRRYIEPAPSAAPGDIAAYRLYSGIPANRIAYVPVARPEGTILLEPVASAQPRGRILRPVIPPDTAYRVEEEELRRSGLKITRSVARSRGFDGRTHLWETRRGSVSTTRELPVPRFDAVLPSRVE